MKTEPRPGIKKFISFNSRILTQILVSFIAGYVVFRASEELYRAAPELSKRLKDGLSISAREWPSSIPAIISFGSIAFLIVIFSLLMILIWRPEKLRKLETWTMRVRGSLKYFRWPIPIVMILVVAYLFVFTQLGSILNGSYVRLVLLLILGTLVAIFTTTGEEKFVSWFTLAFGVLLVSSMFICVAQLATVTDFPFSLYWSEGNRLYDYSILFGSRRYIFPEKLTVPSGAIGRQLLWGILFVIPNSPIWLHRLWNAILSTVPYFVLGLMLIKGTRLGNWAKWTFALWIGLFLTQGPIYTPLILSAILVVGFVRPGKLGISLIATAIAAFYASLSRWTWLLAPSAWAACIWLSDPNLTLFKIGKNQKLSTTDLTNFLKRILPVCLVVIIGLVAGMIADPKLLSVQKLSKSTALSQPLLWYRLLPNATSSEGIILSLVIASAPLAILLVWFVLSKRWRLNGLQEICYTGVTFIFLAMGLVTSVKIGGGNNLHNLDMFLVTLALFCGLALRQSRSKNDAYERRISFFSETWPSGTQFLLILVIFLPAWNGMRMSNPIKLPNQQEIGKAQKIVQSQVSQAKGIGEVLFIDQRQLLTFGTIQGVPLVADYEKKYLMDQAMARNTEYFESFYQDLKDQRFSLIISDPLFTQEKGEDYSFGEENDAWVRWVAKPLLCYYKPLRTLSGFRVQLLIPQSSPNNCQ